MKHTYQYLIVLLLSTSSLLFGQSGAIDNTFGNNGIVLYEDAGYRPEVRAIIQVDDQEINTFGHRQNGFGSQLQMLGYHTDGTVNENFGFYNLAGNPTWGYPGIINTDFSNLVWEHITSAIRLVDGRFVVGGYAGIDFDWMIARYHANGTIDSTFNSVGYKSQDEGGFEQVTSVQVNASNQLVAFGKANNRMTLRRYTDDGSIDQSFGENGTKEVGPQNAYSGNMIIAPNGKIYICGTHSQTDSYRLLIARLLPNGDLDMTYGNNGLVEITRSAFWFSNIFITLTQDEHVVVTSDDLSNFGNNSKLFLANMLPNGDLDTSFGNNGTITHELGEFVTPHDIISQTNGKILITGRLVINNIADMFVSKFNNDGTLDTSFGLMGTAISGFASDLNNNSATSYTLTLQHDGHILLGGLIKESAIQKAAVVRILNNIDSTYTNVHAQYRTAEEITLSPNPFTADLRVTIPSGNWETLRVLDMNGHCLFSTQGPFDAAYHLQSENLASGVSIIQLLDEDRIITKLAIKDQNLN